MLPPLPSGLKTLRAVNPNGSAAQMDDIVLYSEEFDRVFPPRPLLRDVVFRKVHC